MLLRVFGNANGKCVSGGSLSLNGSGRFNDITTPVLEGIKKLSVSYIWFTGILEHATKGDEGVKGEAGSPYAIKDYYDVNPYMGSTSGKRMKEFSDMVERTHKSGMGVIIDFVPNHLAKAYDTKSKAGFTDDNFYPGKIHDGDWSDTVKLNYGNKDTWQKMLDILLFWGKKGVDGFRCDMVELVPTVFWEWCIPQVKAKYPSIIFIAEVYQPSNYNEYLYRGNFDYLYDKSGFYDTLRSILTQGHPACSLTYQWQKLGDLQPHMLNFMENHDEQRLASDFFMKDPHKALAAVFVSLHFNTAPFMLYFGQEFGERGMDIEGFSGLDGKTSIFDFWSLSCIRRWKMGIDTGEETRYLTNDEAGLLRIYRIMLHNAVNDPVFSIGKTFDLEYANLYSCDFDPNKQFAFLRFHEKRLYLCVANFSDTDVNLKICIPKHAFEYFGIAETKKLSSSVPRGVVVNANSCFVLKLY